MGGGGGVLICAKNDLEPEEMFKGGEKAEMIGIKVKVAKREILVISGYAPTEGKSKENKDDFWSMLEEEIKKGKEDNLSILAEIDANCKLAEDGKESRSSEKMKEIVNKFSLKLVNKTTKAIGRMTRRRKTVKKQEESVLDYLLISEDLFEDLKQMKISNEDDDKLTNYTVKEGKDPIHSDHLPIIADFNLSYKTEQKKNETFLNVKNKKSLEVFKEVTETNENYLEIVKKKEDINVIYEKWEKELKSDMLKSFKVTKLRKKKPEETEIQKLMKERRELLEKGINCKDVNERIKEEIKLKRIKEFNKIYKSYHKDGVRAQNSTIMWRRFSKIASAGTCRKTMKRDRRGKIIKDEEHLKRALQKEYKDRLRRRPVRKEFEELERLQQLEFIAKYNVAYQNDSKDFTEAEVDKVLKELNTRKSKDEKGLHNLLLCHKNISGNLKRSLKECLNKIRKVNRWPKALRSARITTIPKKGNCHDLTNERGIFIVSKVRAILSRLLYNRHYETINKKMSDYNVGARKSMSARDNIFTITAIINEAVQMKNETIISVYDYRQMFDALDVRKSLAEVFNLGLSSADFCLMYKSNQHVTTCVKTPNGQTNKTVIKDSNLQGDTPAPLNAAVAMDKIARDAEEEMKDSYMYRSKVKVNILGMIDDLLAISKPGIPTVQLNSLINEASAGLGLQFGMSKCKKLEVARDEKETLETEVKVDVWTTKEQFDSGDDIREDKLQEAYTGKEAIKTVTDQKYLGVFINNKGKMEKTVDDRVSKAKIESKKVLEVVKQMSTWEYEVETGVRMRDSILVSSMIYSLEAMPKMTEAEVRKLEQEDEKFLRMLTNMESKTPLPGLYLELGVKPIRFEVKVKRLMYLHHLLNLDKDKLIAKILKEQSENPKKNDWINIVKEDLKACKIEKTFDEIKEMSKMKFKTLVKKKIKEEALEYLNNKKEKLSKLKDLKYDELKMEDYLRPNNNVKSSELKEVIMRERLRMTRVKRNFKNAEKSLLCTHCETEEETTEHIVRCHKMKSHEPIDLSKLKYGNLSSMKREAEKLKEVLEEHEEKKEKAEEDSKTMKKEKKEEIANPKKMKTGPKMMVKGQSRNYNMKRKIKVVVNREADPKPKKIRLNEAPTENHKDENPDEADLNPKAEENKIQTSPVNESSKNLCSPKTSAPETSALEISAPETSAPEISAPEISAPETSAQETSARKTLTSEHSETSAPETSAQETSAQVTSAIKTSASEDLKASAHTSTSPVQIKQKRGQNDNTRAENMSLKSSVTEAREPEQADECLSWQREPEQADESLSRHKVLVIRRRDDTKRLKLELKVNFKSESEFKS